MQGLTGLLTNPVLANGVAGLATSATAQATVQVCSPMQPDALGPRGTYHSQIVSSSSWSLQLALIFARVFGDIVSSLLQNLGAELSFVCCISHLKCSFLDVGPFFV